VTDRARHLHEERLYECYLAIKSGEGVDPPLAEHLTDCDECGERYAKLTQFLEGLTLEAAAEADAIFTPERLRAQQQHILRRIEHLGHPARVISFPSRTASRHFPASAPRSLRRWVAAAAAAGLFVGVGTGLFLDWEAGRGGRIRRPAALVQQTAFAAPPAPIQIAGPSAIDIEADEAFLSEIEVAGQRPRISELLAVDALTPHVREVSLR
jgi:hypothetical protein